MAGSDRYITVKVLVSYLFLLFIAVFSVTYIYNLIEETDLIEQSDALPRQKSYLVNQTLSLIYESEAIGQLLDQASNMGHYNRTLKQAKQNLDSLRSLTTDSVQQLKIDTIGQLLDQKRWYTKQLMETWKESLTERIYITNIERLIEIPDTVVNEVVIQKHIEVQQDTVVVPRKRLGFFKRLAEVFVPTKQDTSIIINTTEHVVMDTLVRSYNPADTIVSVLRSLQDSVIEQRGQLINELQERARNLRYNNSLLTNRINLLLRDIEKEELEISMNQMLKRQDLLRETSQLIARIAVGSVVVVLLFSLLIGHDLSRSRFYRQQLERAKRHAEQLSEGRERLMLAISHDIRAPLSSIMGYIELLLRRHPDDRQRYFLENMQSSSEHILSLVNDLLDDQRLAAGEMEIHAIPFRLATLFQEIHTSFKPLADARGLQFVLNLKEEKLCDRVYLSDPIRIRQMVGNLLSNAFKFTQEGRVVVLVSLREQDAQQYELAVSVSDTGCGIGKADQAHLFEEFSRLENAAEVEGFGLGLSITLKLLQLMGGSITLTSDVGKGSDFTIHLPIRLADDQSLQEENRTEDVQLSVAEGYKVRCLLVDDDPLQLTLTEELLRQSEVQVLCCSDPHQVLKQLQNTRFDAVVTDIQMPGWNGYELLRKIRTSGIPGTESLPVVALSASIAEESQHYLQAGFTAFLNKPFTPAQLITLLNQILSLQLRSDDRLDFSSLTAFANGDPEAEQSILKMFREETDKHIALLKQALQEEDQELSARIAHKIIPLFRMSGANELVQRLRLLEKREIADEDAWRRLLSEVIEQVSWLVQTLQQETVQRN